MFLQSLKEYKVDLSAISPQLRLLVYHCDPIEYVSSIKYLGIYFDCDLSWTTHMTHLCRRLRSVSCMLYNIKRFLPFSVRKMLCTLWSTVY